MTPGSYHCKHCGRELRPILIWTCPDDEQRARQPGGILLDHGHEPDHPYDPQQETIKVWRVTLYVARGDTPYEVVYLIPGWDAGTNAEAINAAFRAHYSNYLNLRYPVSVKSVTVDGEDTNG